MSAEPYKIPGVEYLAAVPDPKHPRTVIHHVTGGRPPEVCSACGSSKWHAHDTRLAKFRDVPFDRHHIFVLVKRKRMKCASCGATKSYILDEFDERRLMTRRLLSDVIRHCFTKPHAEYERETGVPTSTVGDIAKEQARKLDASRVIEPPKQLGVDEFFVLGRANGIFTDVARRTIYDCMPGRREEHFEPVLKKLHRDGPLELIVSDMYRAYRPIFAKHARGVPVVIDRFHVVRMANNVMELVRRRVQGDFSPSLKKKLKKQRGVLLADRCELAADALELLDFWLSKSDYLRSFHKAKDGFGVIYDYKDRTDAEKAYADWVASIDPQVRVEFEPMIRAIEEFRRDIFNFFDFEYTNGFTESVNRLVKDMNRLGRGYSWDTLRARMLHYEFIRDIEKKTYRKADVTQIVDDHYLSIRGADRDGGAVMGYWAGWTPPRRLGPKVDDVAAWIRTAPDYRADLDDDYDVNITYPFYRIDEPGGQLPLLLDE